MVQDEQISLKDIILKIIAFKNLIVKNWFIILLFGAIGGGLGYLKDYLNKEEVKYTASTIFFLETSQPQTDRGGLGAFLPMQVQQSSGLFSGNNLNMLINSTDFLEKVLLKEVDVFGKKVILANYFFEKAKTKEDLEREAEEKKEKMPPQYTNLAHNNRTKLSPEDIKSLTVVVAKAAGSTTLLPLEGSSFMQLEVETANDTLSKIYSDVFMESLKDYYMETKTGKLYTAVEKQKAIVDSLRYLLQSNDANLARIQEKNQQITIFESSKVDESRATRKNQLLTETYREQEMALSRLKFQTYQETPLFKITTPQRLPILPNKDTMGKSIKPGIFIGMFLCLIFIVIRNAVRAVLKTA